MNCSDLTRRLHRLFARRKGVSVRFDRGRLTTVGLEHRDDPKSYHWDGLDRGGRAGSPFFIFQYTLAGYGVFEQRGVSRRVEAGQSFVAVVPSAHRYYLPGDSPGWSFVWFLLPHEYIVRRMIRRLAGTDGVQSFAPDSPVITSAVRLIEGVCAQSFRDEFAWESAAFDFLMEFERSFAERKYERSQRDRLLAELADRVLHRLDRPLDVETVAAERGMSRSQFSHHFKSATGLSPAKYITDVRLDQVTQRLTRTDDKLETIAKQTGFADANHLCKVFRRSLHVSPGEYRKQLAGR